MKRNAILIVDDERRMADSMRDLLRQAGYQVEATYNGLEALEAMQQRQYSVIVTDLRMSGMNGLDLTRAIQEQYPDTLIIVATAYASTESAIEALHCKVFDYIRKPFDFEVLRLSIDKALQTIETHQLRADTAAMISHDIKIPLTSIIGFAAMIHDRETGELHPRAREFAETIEINGQKILDLIENYLATCKIDVGALAAQRDPIDVRAVFDEVVSLAMFSARRRGCEIIKTWRDLPPRLMLDEALVYRAIANLIQNALKYNINAQPIECLGQFLGPEESPLGRETLLLEICNVTQGLAEEDLQEIFLRFRRGRYVRGASGSGIGLYVVRAVAEAHDGLVRAELRTGDRFAVQLFLATEPGEGSDQQGRGGEGSS